MAKLNANQARRIIGGAIGGVYRDCDPVALRAAVRFLADADEFWSVLADWDRQMPQGDAIALPDKSLFN